MSRSCSVGKPEFCIALYLPGNVDFRAVRQHFCPLNLELSDSLPYPRSSTANGIAARFSSSTDRCRREGFGTGFDITKNCLYCFYNGYCSYLPSTLRSSTYQPYPICFPFHMLHTKPFHNSGAQFKSASSL